MEEKKYNAFPIPAHVLQQKDEQDKEREKKQDAEQEKKQDIIRNETPAGDSRAAFDISSGYAEIEYNTYVIRNKETLKAIDFFSSITPSSQTITYKPVDPIRQKFFDMRSLASKKPYAKDDSELFYRQAKFMEDFTDDYIGEAKLNMYFPYYQHMGYEQLRTYFSWRTRIRESKSLALCGRPPSYVSYVFLYIYELLSNIGVENPSQAIAGLLSVLNEYAGVYPGLAKYLPRWIKDYIVFYGVPVKFEDFVKENNLYCYYPDLFLFDLENENILEVWNSISNYDVNTSKFYEDGNKERLKDYFRAVLIALSEFYNDYFEKNDKKSNFENIIIYRLCNRVAWYPFKNALFYYFANSPDGQVHLPGGESYYCKSGRWSTNYPVFYSNRDSIAGHLIKKTEVCLRELLKYKYKLKLSPRSFNHALININELDKLIEKAVIDHYNYINRKVVKVDFDNLKRIREEALNTQDKLIVEESELGIRNEELGITISPSLRGSEAYEAIHSTGSDYISDEWNALKEAFDEIEIQAMQIALQDSFEIKSFADKNGIMLEVLIDGINEKAADIIGDNIIDFDDELTIYEDYIDNIKEILGIKHYE